MRLLYSPRSLLLVCFFILCLNGVGYASALSLSRVRPAGTRSVIETPTPPPRSFWRRLFDHLPSSASSSRVASGKILARWVDDHPRLIESLKSYEDEVVIRFNISHSQHEAVLRAVVGRMLLDVWGFTDNHVDIRIPSRRVRFLIRALPSSLRENHSILIPDLARAAVATYPSHQNLAYAHQLYDRGTASSQVPQKERDAVDIYFQDYQPYSSILAWMRLVESMYHGRGLVQMISIGTSYEGRDIPALRVGIQPDEGTSERQREIILVTGGLHAREWITTSSVNYAAWSFIHLADHDPKVKKILERFDLVFIPLLNPDGYEYTWEVDRLWRKSRQRTKMSYCQGFDLDHSFSYQWDAAGHQDEPCSGSFGGDEPFQAVEAAQLAGWAANMAKGGSKFVGYLDIHSYSQQVLVPYSFSCRARPPNRENLQEVAMNLAKHMRLTNGELYTVASACEGAVTGSTGPMVETRGGSAIDYFYHEFNAHYSYQIKLRDTGSYGFLLPRDNIVPAGEEIFQAMKYLGDYLHGNNGHESTQDTIVHDGSTQGSVEDDAAVSEL